MFYLTWATPEIKESHAILGVIDEINTEMNCFKVTKLICITEEGKMAGLEMDVSFTKEIGKGSSIKVRLTHNLDPYMKPGFDNLIQNIWPETFRLFKEFVEN